VFLKNNLYGNFLVQIMFCILSFYGLWEWNFNKKIQKNAIDSEIIKYKVIPKNQYLILFLANTLLFLGIYVVFIYFFKLEINIVNILDILSSTGSIVAQYLLTKKYIENWFFWVVVNVLVILMTFLSGLYITLFLYLIFFGLAIHGYFNWKKF
jgi:nicotinamide mononucleotide transporter